MVDIDLFWSMKSTLVKMMFTCQKLYKEEHGHNEHWIVTNLVTKFRTILRNLDHKFATGNLSSLLWNGVIVITRLLTHKILFLGLKFHSTSVQFTSGAFSSFFYRNIIQSGPIQFSIVLSKEKGLKGIALIMKY